MTTLKTTQKQKVINKLVKNGNNLENATKYANEHFDYVSRYYKGVSKMAEVIMSL